MPTNVQCIRVISEQPGSNKFELKKYGFVKWKKIIHYVVCFFLDLFIYLFVCLFVCLFHLSKYEEKQITEWT